MDFLQRLKHETTPEHHQLEKRLDLLRESLTLADYKMMVSRFYGFYATFEAEYFSHPHDSFFDDRKKLPLLEKDLKALNLSPDSVPKLPLSQLVPLKTQEEQLGCLYVLEGSTLGGQVLVRHFSQKLGLTPDSGMAYFAGYQDKTIEKWRQFQQKLVESLQNMALKQDVIISSAKATFTTMEHWLCHESSLS